MDADTEQPSPVSCPWLQPPVDWSSSDQNVPKLSWGDTLCGKELEDVAAFHAWECPFAAGVSPGQRNLPVAPVGSDCGGDEAML